MNLDILTLLFICFIAIICYRFYITSDEFQLTCILSDVDGKRYCVREREKLSEAADRLAKVNDGLKRVVDYCCKEYKNDERIKRLEKGFNPRRIYETLPTSQYTAYSENKGEKLAFCLNTEKNQQGKLIDENTLMFVALHELTHICTKSVGHTEEFWNNFKFILDQAVKIGVYDPVDYSKQPAQYCGMEINDNPYFDQK